MRSKYPEIKDKRVKECYYRTLQEMQKNYTVFFEKLFIYKLHTEFGFGKKRLNEIIEAVANCVDEMQSNPVFWDKVDEDVIDNLGFDYTRCDYETLEKIFYNPPKISMEEKRKDLATFAKIQNIAKGNNNHNRKG